jgi:hypothetical protein
MHDQREVACADMERCEDFDTGAVFKLEQSCLRVRCAQVKAASQASYMHVRGICPLLTLSARRLVRGIHAAAQLVTGHSRLGT